MSSSDLKCETTSRVHTAVYGGGSKHALPITALYGLVRRWRPLDVVYRPIRHGATLIAVKLDMG
jgi:hypothetical protein